MALKSWRDLLDDGPAAVAPPEECTYIAPSTDYPLTFDALAALIRDHPEVVTQRDRLCYERERVDLGDGFVLITAACFTRDAA